MLDDSTNPADLNNGGFGQMQMANNEFHAMDFPDHNMNVHVHEFPDQQDFNDFDVVPQEQM
jgi:hypothetical protein